MTEASARPTRPGGPLRFVRDIVLIVVIALVVSLVVKAFLVRSFYVPSGSMEHTLDINDRILVNELVPAVGALKRGDVVVFTDPGGWLPAADEKVPPATPLSTLLNATGLRPTDSNDHLVKRVIGLPGDEVTCCSVAGHLEVNGAPLAEPYLNLKAGASAGSDQSFDVTVPAGDLWVMGDNRNHSADSRANLNGPTHGFVPIADVVGRAFVITWPVDRWAWLGTYPATFARVPTAPAAR